MAAEAILTLIFPKECIHCEYSPACMGGAKCQSFAKTGNYRDADPACPKRRYIERVM